MSKSFSPLDDGSQPPQRKEFLDASFDQERCSLHSLNLWVRTANCVMLEHPIQLVEKPSQGQREREILYIYIYKKNIYSTIVVISFL